MSLSEHVIQDYASTSLSIKAHPVSFIRDELKQLNVLSASDLGNAKPGSIVKTAGLILVRQRPGTASGICFVTLEDETGTSNLVVFRQMFDKYRKEIVQSKLLLVEGELQREGEVIHVIVRRCHNASRLLGKLALTSDDQLSNTPRSRSDETSSPFLDKKHSGDSVQMNIFPEGRNFR